MQTVDGVCLTLALLAGGVYWYLVTYLSGVEQRHNERRANRES